MNIVDLPDTMSSETVLLSIICEKLNDAVKILKPKVPNTSYTKYHKQYINKKK